MEREFLTLTNASSAALSGLPEFSFASFRERLVYCVNEKKYRLCSFFALPEQNGSFRLISVLADDEKGMLLLGSAVVEKEFASLTCDAPAFHWFEREIYEQYGVLPAGHPWLKPIRFQAPDAKIGVTDYFTMAGSAVHEVAVGPVHAGVIEPGHFRFQCLGETVCHLEIELGYQHRGIEKMLEGTPDKRTVHWMETASGDSSIASASAYAQLVEALDPSFVPSEDALKFRAAAAELERMANHIGDLGALAGDVAFLPTASYCGRLRGEYLNMTAVLCGNRFGRGVVVPGGIGFELGAAHAGEILKRMKTFYGQLRNALDLMFDAPSVLDRFEHTGTVSPEDGAAIGMVGVAARAGGAGQDVRSRFPYGAYRKFMIERSAADRGDVLARATVRRKEIAVSDCLIRRLLSSISGTTAPAELRCPSPRPDSIAVSLVEAWRGELCHVAVTGGDGKFRRYKITDPSFHNWFGLALALRGEAISDFPICNKSFNLSYCGHDL